MKLVAVFLCVCVAGSLGSILPTGAGAINKAAVGVGKVDVEAVKVEDKQRDVKNVLEAKQDWENNDLRKSRVAQNWDQTSRNAAKDSNARAQDYSRDASKWDEKTDASNKTAAKAAATSADKAGHQAWSGSNRLDQNQNWAGQGGWRKGNRRHEGISYAFDKKFDRNANENGGYNAGSKLADHALDDYADRSSSYDRMVNDHGARAANADRQSADRNAANGHSAWANQNAADKFGRDADQAAGAHANDRDWAEKRDNARTANRYNEDGRVTAFDALNDQALVDRNANRKAVGYGAKDAYGKNYAYGAPYGYGYAGKGVGLAGKGLERVAGGADKSNVWDSAQRNKNQKWAGDNWVDRSKNSALANQWQQDQIKGFNKDQAASLNDKGYSSDAAARDQGVRSANNQWAAADAAKAASQARHDLDEEAHLRANNKWRQSDRDHKLNEWKKFYSNDKKGGQNWERLKYNRDQTDDAAAADFNAAKDNANKWQDGHRFDTQSQAARGADSARARDAQDRHRTSDWSSDANGAQQQSAQAADAASKGVWGANDYARKNQLEQAAKDYQNKDAQAWDRGTQRAGYDKMGYNGAKSAYGAAGIAAPGYNNYGYGYPNNYGYGYPGYGNYGNYGYGNDGYGKGYYY